MIQSTDDLTRTWHSLCPHCGQDELWTGVADVSKNGQIMFQLILNFASAFGTFESGHATSLSYQAAS